MLQLDYDDQVEDNPWRPVRLVLCILWIIHFFVCAFTTVGVFAELFTVIFDITKVFDLQSVR